MPSGLHHVTSITENVQANVDFYIGFLNLKLVKRTIAHASGERLHLFYGDGLGSPGSLLTFVVWEGWGRGRTGIGQVSEIGLAIPQNSLGDWLTKALAFGYPIDGPLKEFREPTLRLKDPDGLIIKLVGVDICPSLPPPNAPSRLRGVTILTDKASATTNFLANFGYRPGPRSGATQRLVSETDVIDLREASGFVTSVPGAGIPDHVSLRAPDAEAVQAMQLALKDDWPTEVHDERYFLSLHTRGPAEVLIQYSTDLPGMTVDEAPDQLGQDLRLPSDDNALAEALKVTLPQFALPWEERFPIRDLGFVHRLHQPENPDGTTLVLLHDTGGDEASLMLLGHRLAPQALLLGVRGRSSERATRSWFGRSETKRPLETEIRSEAEAFSSFIEAAITSYALDSNRVILVGCGNGGELLAALIQLHGEFSRRAILLCSSGKLDEPPALNLSATSVLLLSGSDGLSASKTEVLARNLTTRGARVELREVSDDNMLTTEDLLIAKRWISQNVAPVRKP